MSFKLKQTLNKLVIYSPDVH